MTAGQGAAAEIAGLADQFRRRKRSPVEVVDGLLRDIRERDGLVQSYLTVTGEEAIAAAREAERKILAGEHASPLAGVPIALKDVILTKGVRTTANSRILQDHVPRIDAEVVRRLKAAGAVIIGKSTCHEFAHGGPSFDLPWPPARNPWDLDRFTGGSSSGSGAALAAGLAYGALGTDTGGSIRNPAAFCGVAGIRPTPGLVSLSGIIQNAPSFDACGPMARTSLDCGLILDAIIHDDGDPKGAARAGLAEWLHHPNGTLRGVRVGMIWNFLEEGAPDEVRENLRACEDALAQAGATAERVDVRPLSHYHAVRITIAESELYEYHRDRLRQRTGEFGEDFLVRCLPACLLTRSDYIRAAWLRRQIQAEWTAVFHRFDVIVTAGALRAAPRFDEYKPIAFWRKPSITTPFSTWPGPSASARSGFGRDGLPLAIQVAGRPYEDALVLRVGQAIEQTIGAGPRIAPVASTPSTSTSVADPLFAPDAASADAAERALRAEWLPVESRYTGIIAAGLPHIEEMRRTIGAALQEQRVGTLD